MSALTREARALVEAAGAEDGWHWHDGGRDRKPYDLTPDEDGYAYIGQAALLGKTNVCLNDNDETAVDVCRLIARAPTLLAEMADRMERLEAVVRVVRKATDGLPAPALHWGELDAALDLGRAPSFADTRAALDALLGDE